MAIEEKTLKKISFILSLVGIVILYFLLLTIEIPETTISEITSDDIGQIITMRGTVLDVKENNKTATIQLSQEQSIEIFLFKKEPIQISKGAKVSIEGEIKETNQIVAHSIKGI